MEQIVLANGSVIEYDVKNGRVVGHWPMKKTLVKLASERCNR